MNLILKKLRSKAGESLVESMAAILIFTMASLVMYTMVTAAGDINKTAKEKDQQIQTQMLAAEMGEGAGQEGTISMTITTASGTVNVFGGEVEVYGTPGSTLYSYFEKEGG